MCDFLRDEQREEVAIAPLLLLGPPRQFSPRAARVGQVQPLQQGIERLIRERHDRPPSALKGSTVLGRVQALRFAPALRAPAAAWTRPARGAGLAVADGRSSESCPSREIGSPGCPTNDDRSAG